MENIEKLIYFNLEQTLGKTLLDQYFDFIWKGFTKTEILDKYNININQFNFNFEVVDKKVKTFLTKNGYNDNNSVL